MHKTVLSVVDRIWNSGGRLADLVDRDDVSFFVPQSSLAFYVVFI